MAKVLIVEDEPITAMDMAVLMEDWGHEFLEPAITGTEAVRRARAEKPDIILMDINLPGEMDGIKAAEEIRKTLDVPIIFLTGYLAEGIRELINLPGKFDIVSKPFDYDELREKMESLLDADKDKIL